MKNNKQKKNLKKPEIGERETIKAKKKSHADDYKVDLKSSKFWNEVYDDGDDHFDKPVRE